MRFLSAFNRLSASAFVVLQNFKELSCQQHVNDLTAVTVTAAAGMFHTELVLGCSVMSTDLAIRAAAHSWWRSLTCGPRRLLTGLILVPLPGSLS